MHMMMLALKTEIVGLLPGALSARVAAIDSGVAAAVKVLNIDSNKVGQPI